jgi:hypothetical protein
MSRNKNIIAFFLFLLFSTVALPPDFFHQFTEHHDTIDCFSNENAIHSEHQHCLSLQLSLPSYIPTEQHNETKAITVIENKISLPTSFLVSTFTNSAQGRAPPH